MGWFDDNEKKEFKVGEKVRVRYREEEGWIIDKKGDLYTVSIHNGDFVDSYRADQLEKCK